VSEAVRVEHDGPVTTVILGRPDRRNAVDGPTAAALADAFRAFEADESASAWSLRSGAICAWPRRARCSGSSAAVGASR
jgi:enoyl-CoA hydratase